MAFPLLLPLLLGGADPQVIATGDRERVEQVMSDELRARVAKGWSVVDARTVNGELVFTLAKGESYERHVVTLETGHTYRIEPEAKPPIDAFEPSSFFTEAVASVAGGFEIESSCGEWYPRPYAVDDHATGEFATSLISRTLATADNLLNVDQTPSRVTFLVVKRKVRRELVVWLDRKGGVIEAQLRRFELDNGDGGQYARMPALKKTLAKTRVIAIDAKGLVTPKGRFVLDPDGDGYGYYGDDSGCGC